MESLNSMIKRLIRSKCSLPELVYRLLNFAKGKNQAFEFTEEKSNEIINILSKNYILSKIKEEYSDFIYNKCLLGFIKAQSYQCDKVKKNVYEIVSIDPSDIRKFKVECDSNGLSCGCWYNKQWGVPCLHMFAVTTLSPEKFFNLLPFKRRWLKKESDVCTDDKLLEFLEDNIGKEKINKGSLLVLS